MTPLVDAETKVVDRPKDHHGELRLWLRLLTCTTMIEREVRRRLAERFDTTLPRFDLMAQLDKTREGLTLGEISRRMMVSNGNVTGLVDRLVEAGLLERRQSAADRRKHLIRLTAEGQRRFAAMASAHADWISQLVAGLDEDEMAALMALLAKTKGSVARATVSVASTSHPGR